LCLVPQNLSFTPFSTTYFHMMPSLNSSSSSSSSWRVWCLYHAQWRSWCRTYSEWLTDAQRHSMVDTTGRMCHSSIHNMAQAHHAIAVRWTVPLARE
jgi:hypothetical protein